MLPAHGVQVVGVEPERFQDRGAICVVSTGLVARFFKVHPGFLVDDPEGYHTELVSDLRTTEGKLDVWLLQGSESFASDPEVSEVLLKAAREKDTRRCFLLLGAILDTPGLAERLLEALRPESATRKSGEGRRTL